MDKTPSPHSRGSFSGRIGYVLAVAGSAVGLGNIWRFPYLAARYGGGMFLLTYLILMVTFGYVLIVSETALGRMTRKSPGGPSEPSETACPSTSAAGSTPSFPCSLSPITASSADGC